MIDEQQANVGIERAVRRVGRLVHEPALSGRSDVDRAFLAAMAVDTGPSRIADIAQRLGVNTTYAGQYRLRLMSAELITPAGHGQVRFELPYLREYLLQAGGTGEHPPFGPDTEQAAALYRATFTGEPGIAALPPAPESAPHLPSRPDGQHPGPGRER